MYKPDVVIYHGGCIDGFGAAYLAAKHWPGVQLEPASYDDIESVVARYADKHVLMADIACVCAAGAAAHKCESLIILDHHKTTHTRVQGARLTTLLDITRACLQSPYPKVGVDAYINDSRSGTALMWLFLEKLKQHPALPPQREPDWVQYVEDRDLWRFLLTDTRAFHAAVSIIEQTVATWDEFLAGDMHKHIAVGNALLLQTDRNINAVRITERDIYWPSPEYGHDNLHGIAVNAPYWLASETGNAVLKDNPHVDFALIWSMRSDGLAQVSLRSTDTRADVSKLAEAFGGGGHRNAAGCKMEMLRLLGMLSVN